MTAMGRITKPEAQVIARKLEATIVPGGAHDLAQISSQGRPIAQFVIRRGSNRDAPHDYIASQIHLSKRECEAMARCLIGRKEWIAIMKDKGLIEESTPPTTPEDRPRPRR